MKKFVKIVACWMLLCLSYACYSQKNTTDMKFEVTHTEEEWKELLSEEQYKVLREKGTERAFTGIYYNYKKVGTYVCAGCQKALFHSTSKYISGTGWPSFYEPVDSKAVLKKTDHSHNLTRTEVVCSRCGGHLGHVFSDGPEPTGLRYCLNSVSLLFQEEKK